MGNWFYEGKYSVQFTVDNVTKDSWEDFKMIPEKKPVMQAPDLGLRLFKRFEFSVNYIIEDNNEVDDIIDDIIEYLHGKTGSITVGENTYTALFNVADISAEDHYTTFRLQAILSDFDPEDPDNTLDFGDFNTWTDWHLIPDETLKIVPPQLKEKYVDIPGRNGAIDLCNAVVGLPRFERMTGSLSFTIYDNDPDAIYNDMLDNLHGHKFDEVEIMGKSYDGRWVIESYEPDGEEPKITLGYNLILHDWTFNEEGGDVPTTLEIIEYLIAGTGNDNAKTSGITISVKANDIIYDDIMPLALRGSAEMALMGSVNNSSEVYIQNGIPIVWSNVRFNSEMDTSAITINERRMFIVEPTNNQSSYSIGYYKTTDYGFHHRIYGVQIYRMINGVKTLISDFVPAKRKSDNVLGLYDKIQVRFYTNSGSVNFQEGSA